MLVNRYFCMLTFLRNFQNCTILYIHLYLIQNGFLILAIFIVIECHLIVLICMYIKNRDVDIHMLMFYMCSYFNSVSIQVFCKFNLWVVCILLIYFEKKYILHIFIYTYIIIHMCIYIQLCIFSKTQLFQAEI